MTRDLLFSVGTGDAFQDIHASIILGETADGTDLLVIEKMQIGSSVRVVLLSKVLREYSHPATAYKGTPEVSVLSRPLQKILAPDVR